MATIVPDNGEFDDYVHQEMTAAELTPVELLRAAIDNLETHGLSIDVLELVIGAEAEIRTLLHQL